MPVSSEQSRQMRASFTRSAAIDDRPIEVQRREWEQAALQTALPPDTHIEAIVANNVPCEWVRANSADASTAVLYLHGGGFNAGSPRTHRAIAADLSRAAGAAVLLVDYRLAPEHPFPAALEDTGAVYRWLIDQGFAPQKLAIGGDSAGAQIAVSVLLALREQHITLPAAGVLLSPWLDLSLSGESMQTRADIDPLTTHAGLAHAAHLYIGDRDARDPLISPVFADLHGLPPLLIQVGDHEILLSDAQQFAAQAQAGNVSVTLEIWPEMWHVWHGFGLPESQEAFEHLGAFLRQQLA
jgi:epsilon-lactone hydrolase